MGGCGGSEVAGDGEAPCARRKDLRSKVAAQIKAWRLAREETQATVAIALGVAESTVNMWEKGERFPNPENLLGLAEVLGIPPCRFFQSADSACLRHGHAGGCENAGIGVPPGPRPTRP